MQKIQQYEASGYARASLSRLQEVLNALGGTATVDVNLFELLNLEDFKTPAVAGRSKR